MGFLGRLFPRFAEPINEVVYRFTGKVRCYAVLVLLLFDVAGYLDPGALGADVERGRFWTAFAHMPLLVVVGVLGLLLWKAPWSMRTLRRIHFASIALEACLGFMLLSALGSVTNYMIFMHACLIVSYRIGFDFRVGVFALVAFLGGHWLVVIGELTGVLSPQWVLTAEPAQVYLDPSMQVWTMVAISLSFLFLYWSANLSVARLRHKDRAIRMLRAVIEANRDVETGQHSGETFGARYSLAELLGRGGMGEVYRGRHVGTKREVAVKTLHPHLADDEHQLRRFQREAEIVGQLGCDHIVQVLDVDRHGEIPFMVFEYLEGETLGARVSREGALPVETVARIVRQVALGLEVAHDAGVVHRDLKPANIFLCERPDGLVAKILDFGISKIHSDATALTQDVALLGTPSYMSPEQTGGLLDLVDRRSDVFALGAVVYTVLTGERPFSASSIPTLLLRIRDNEPPPPSKLRPELPEQVDAVLALAMAKRARERYASASEFGRDFEAALRGELEPAVSERARAIHRGAPTPVPVPAPVRVEASAKVIALDKTLTEPN